MGEDACIATKLLAAGWQLAYCAEAQVFHSHPYTWLQQVRRNFDTGVFHARESWILGILGGAEAEGLRFVRSEWAYLAEKCPENIPNALSNTIGKFVGYKLGMSERLLPSRIKSILSMSKTFWVDARQAADNIQSRHGE
jgi:rhamnosyltransferase